ncbi:MAG: Alanyl-tRNA synthetase [uncultured Rubrobacteraceae bacterium]|uniref:Alanyl-tRNA synthetase n=1 Tax=uncultured Rubrobacteraceae bacterium TaxID=349277 RepID=A0A6J4QNA3_9ACTN|nr:MAG: Alanyl-tRNA synthetase [uncultured Rubrobacteraceae bacterium]
MRLSGLRYAEALGKARGRRNVTLGVVKHLWRSPVPFIGFYTPEGVKVTGDRLYAPAAPKLVDDAEYLAGVEAHKRAYARDLEATMLPAGNLPGYFEIPTDEGWRITVDLAEKRLTLADAWGMTTTSRVAGDLAPFVWAYRYCGFCVLTIYDKDLGEIRDDLLFVAKRRGIQLRWRQTAA